MVASLKLAHSDCLNEADIEATMLKLPYLGYLVDALVFRLPNRGSLFDFTSLRLPQKGCLIWLLIKAY